MVCKYNLIRTSIDDKWDNFIKKSPSGTMYSSSLYLKVFNVDAYYCYKQNELMAAVLCLTSKDGKSIVGNDLVIYDGLIYRDLSHLNISQKNSEEFKIQEYVANEIFNIYEKVSFKMHPSIVDIRPFLWKNYHSSDDGYLLDLHYTCYIDISDFSQNKSLNELKIYKNASSARRQEIRYAIKKNVKTTLSTDVYMFINFFQMTFDRQDITLDKVFLRDMLIIIKNLIENNKTCKNFRIINIEKTKVNGIDSTVAKYGFSYAYSDNYVDDFLKWTVLIPVDDKMWVHELAINTSTDKMWQDDLKETIYSFKLLNPPEYVQFDISATGTHTISIPEGAGETVNQTDKEKLDEDNLQESEQTATIKSESSKNLPKGQLVHQSMIFPDSDKHKSVTVTFENWSIKQGNGNFKEIIRLLNTNDLNLNYFSTRLHFSRTCDILPVDKIENNNKCFASFYLMKTKTGVSIYKGIIPKDQFSLFGLEKDVSDFIICEFKPESHYCMVYFDN